jgi:hypothetical protein
MPIELDSKAKRVFRVACLSGGGMRIINHVGMIERLYETLDFHFDGIVGTSAGSLCASYCGWSCDGRWPSRIDVRQRISELRIILGSLRSERDIFGQHGGKAAFYRKILPSFLMDGDIRAVIAAAAAGRSGAFTMGPLRKLLYEHIPKEAVWTSRSRIGAVRYDELGSPYCEVNLSEYSRDGGIEATLASCSIPIWVGPVALDGGQWFDGGVANLSPLAAAVRVLKALSADPSDLLELYLLNCTPHFDQKGNPVLSNKPTKTGIFDIAKWVLEKMLDVAWADDIRRLYLVNRQAASGMKVKSSHRYIEVYSVDPEFIIPQNSSHFVPANLQPGIVNGRLAVENFLKDPEKRKIENLATPEWWESD